MRSDIGTKERREREEKTVNSRWQSRMNLLSKMNPPLNLRIRGKE
jgi:hypothetical protein